MEGSRDRERGREEERGKTQEVTEDGKKKQLSWTESRELRGSQKERMG